MPYQKRGSTPGFWPNLFARGLSAMEPAMPVSCKIRRGCPTVPQQGHPHFAHRRLVTTTDRTIRRRAGRCAPPDGCAVDADGAHDDPHDVPLLLEGTAG